MTIEASSAGPHRPTWWVRRLTAPNPSLETLAGTNTYLVGGGPDGCVVIDPGPADHGHLDRVRALGARRGGVRLILLTHSHHDHVAGAALLRDRTGARILAFSRERVPEADSLLADQAVISLGDQSLVALHTPGHSADHLCFHLPQRGVLFAGDLVAGTGTVFIAPPDGDLAQYLASLRLVLKLSLRRVFPGHGPTVTHPARLFREYLVHRAEREVQTLAALSRDGGAATMDDLLDLVYKDVEPGRRPLAALQMQALLRKLEEAGQARRERLSDGGECWRRIR
ncbi:MAG TPA: MBL fold metallo-hydrolase [Chloroflexota bacterium]|nr:MBL fold metallo-hydrolase [Chloroflexota bacterium]